MKHHWTVVVVTDKQGNIESAKLNNNKTYSSSLLVLDRMPFYIYERSALLRLTDISKTARGETIGRRLEPNRFTIYLSKDEYYEIKDKMLTGVNK
jgi:hypothetical protein